LFFRGVKDRIECNACAGMVEYFSFNFIYLEMGTNAQMGKKHFLKFHGEEVGHLAGVFIDGIL
jgi:hypothetical protein